MSDMSAMNRENKKRQLRRQIVQPSSSNHLRPEEDDKRPGRQGRKKTLGRRLKVLAVAAVIMAVFAVGLYQYLKHYEYGSYELIWEKPMTESSFAGYINFETNVIKYTKDGASYIDSQGEPVWTWVYEMKSPIAYVNGGYAIIADQQGNSICIFDRTGFRGSATTVFPIVKATCSARGVVAALMEDAKATHVNFFKSDGTPIEIDLKFLLSGETGHPVDISISPDGTQLIGAYEYIKNGTINSRVAFHNFSEIGQNNTTRVVGGFEDDYYESSFVVRVRFMTDVHSCAFADDGITFFSTRNIMSPEVVKQIKVEEEIRSVLYSDRYAGVIVSNQDGEKPYRMDIYKADGSEVMSLAFSYQYQYAEIDGDRVLLYNEDSCEIYSMSGNRKFSGTFDFTVSKIRKGRYPNSLIVTGPQAMKEIKLQ